MSTEKPSSGQRNWSTILVDLKRTMAATVLASDIRQYMPQAAPTTAAIFDKVHTFARRLRSLLMIVVLIYIFVWLGLSALYDVTLAPVVRTFAVGLGVTLEVYFLFLWVRFYWQTQLIRYLLGEHWWWTAWLIVWPLSRLSEFADVVAGVLLGGLILIGEIWRRRRAARMAAEVRANLGEWEILSAISIKDMALGRFHPHDVRA